VEKAQAKDAPEAPRPTVVSVEGHLGPAHGLVEAIREAGIPVENLPGPHPARPFGRNRIGRLVVDGVTLTLTDGRSATQHAAESGRGDVVLFDLARDYAGASRIAIAVADGAARGSAAKAAGLFQALGKRVSVLDDLPGLLVMRTVAMLANEAADAVLQNVASAADVDTAMTKGVNYPIGPLAWAETIGLDLVVDVLDALARTYGEDRYRASALLRRKVWGGTFFHD